MKSEGIGGLRRIVDLALAFLAPARCRSCDTPLFGHVNPYLCPDCLERVQWIGQGACRRCGFPSGPYASLDDGCERCRALDPRLTAAASVARYKNGARDLVLALKFRREAELAAPLAALMGERFHAVGLPRCDLVLPVPLHPTRLRERGFDQAGLLAERIGRRLGLPCAKNALRRTRKTKPQSMLARNDRLENMQGAFQATASLAGKKVLLIDDVMTTGATMAECARICREAGAVRVYGLTFAR